MERDLPLIPPQRLRLRQPWRPSERDSRYRVCVCVCVCVCVGVCGVVIISIAATYFSFLCGIFWMEEEENSNSNFYSSLLINDTLAHNVP